MLLKSNGFDKLARLTLIHSRASNITDKDNKMLIGLKKTMQTIECIELALAANGPLTLAELVEECRDQAYAGKLPQALCYLLERGIIKQAQDDSFELA